MGLKLSPIEVQISVRVRAPKNGKPITAGLIREAIRRKADDPFHRDLPGMQLRIVAWRHRIRSGGWNEPRESDRKLWSQFARFLPEASFSVEHITARSR